jgi:hypothetical protein
MFVAIPKGHGRASARVASQRARLAYAAVNTSLTYVLGGDRTQTPRDVPIDHVVVAEHECFERLRCFNRAREELGLGGCQNTRSRVMDGELRVAVAPNHLRLLQSSICTASAGTSHLLVGV